jgi:hemerythrin
VILEWSDKFDTHIDIVDTQHKKLCDLLNKIASCFDTGSPSEEVVEQTLKELLDYANQHFTDEEAMMQAGHIDERHFKVHHMEHNSFMYDLSRLQLHNNADEDEVQTAQKVVRFITSWLVYHILGVDQVMAAQLDAIQKGIAPAQAFEKLQTIPRDAQTTQLILNAVLDLWRGTTDHCRIVEQQLADALFALESLK